MSTEKFTFTPTLLEAFRRRLLTDVEFAASIKRMLGQAPAVGGGGGGAGGPSISGPQIWDGGFALHRIDGSREIVEANVGTVSGWTDDAGFVMELWDVEKPSDFFPTVVEGFRIDSYFSLGDAGDAVKALVAASSPSGDKGWAWMIAEDLNTVAKASVKSEVIGGFYLGGAYERSVWDLYSHVKPIGPGPVMVTRWGRLYRAVKKGAGQTAYFDQWILEAGYDRPTNDGSVFITMERTADTSWGDAAIDSFVDAVNPAATSVWTYHHFSYVWTRYTTT